MFKLFIWDGSGSDTVVVTCTSVPRVHKFRLLRLVIKTVNVVGKLLGGHAFLDSLGAMLVV